MRTLTGFLADRIESLPENQAQAMPGVVGGGNWSALGRRIASRRGPIGGEGKRAKAGIADALPTWQPRRGKPRTQDEGQ